MIAAPPRDVAEGQPVATGGKTRCWETDAVLREGDDVWSRAGVYHPAAVPDVAGAATEPTAHLLAHGRLAVCSDCATQEATLRLVDAEVIGPDDV